MARRRRKPAKTSIGFAQSYLANGVMAWGLVFYMLGIFSWLCINTWEGPNGFKTMVLGPAVGEWSFFSLLTAINVAWLLLLAIHVIRVCLARSAGKWQELSLIATGALLITVTQIAVTNMRAAAHRYDNDRILPDEVMIAHFTENRRSYADILKFIKAHGLKLSNDSGNHWHKLYYKKSGEWERLNTLRQITKTLRDLKVRDHGRRIEFESARNGIGERTSIKSYFYSEELPTPLVTSLDDPAPQEQSYIAYRPIEGNWYLRFSRHR